MITIKWSRSNDPGFLARYFPYSCTNCGMKTQPIRKKIPVIVPPSLPVQGTTENITNPFNLFSKFTAYRHQLERESFPIKQLTFHNSVYLHNIDNVIESSIVYIFKHK
jgi:hypothetical protein